MLHTAVWPHLVEGTTCLSRMALCPWNPPPAVTAVLLLSATVLPPLQPVGQAALLKEAQVVSLYLQKCHGQLLIPPVGEPCALPVGLLYFIPIMIFFPIN